MATKQDDLDMLLGTDSKPALIKKATSVKANAALAQPAKEPLKPWSSLISETNERRLNQFLYWKPGRTRKQDVLNMALKAFFDAATEYSDKAIPPEE